MKCHALLLNIFFLPALLNSICHAAAPPFFKVLPPTSDLPAAPIQAVAINNLGVVAGYELDSNNNIVPLIWVNGAPQKLDYIFDFTVTGVLAINDSNYVLGTGLNSVDQELFVLWEIGNTYLYSPPTPIAGTPLLNNVNHVLTATTTGQFWIWDSNNFNNTLVSTPANTCSPVLSFNDADQFLALVSPTCTNIGAYQYDLISSSGVATPYAAAPGTYDINSINNRAEASGALPGGAEGLNFWTTPASVTQIDKAFYTSGKMNDAGAVAGIFSGLEIYQNGQVQAITLPSPFATPSIVAINDADQVLVSAPASSGTGYTYGVYSPRGKTCAADITRQLEIIPGPITLNTTTGRYTQSIRVENPTSVSYPGPTSLGFIGLPPTVSLLAPSGATLCSDTPQGTAFVTSSLALGPVSQIYFQVQYINPESTPIAYTPSVLGGTGQR